MSDRIGIWGLLPSANGAESAVPLEELQDTDTEQRLESLLVQSPELLLAGLTLIGRQVVTGGGPLDLIGLDEEGRTVLFELKRGTLTRDAVAQILDYASDLTMRSPDEFATLIQQSGTRDGIEPIGDFADWYAGAFANATERPPAGLRMVLVGLGVDERAKRMVNYLAEAGIDIQLLTFQAFKRGDDVFLARRVETNEPSSRAEVGGAGEKERNREELHALAREHGVESLLTTVADFIASRLPASYRWPGKTAFSYSLPDQTDEGRSTQRSYATLHVDAKSSGRLVLTFPERAVAIAGAAVEVAAKRIQGSKETKRAMAAFQIPVTSSSWPKFEGPVGELLDAIRSGWERRVRDQNADDVAEPTLRSGVGDG